MALQLLWKYAPMTPLDALFAGADLLNPEHPANTDQGQIKMIILLAPFLKARWLLPTSTYTLTPFPFSLTPFPPLLKFDEASEDSSYMQVYLYLVWRICMEKLLYINH